MYVSSLKMTGKDWEETGARGEQAVAGGNAGEERQGWTELMLWKQQWEVERLGVHLSRTGSSGGTVVASGGGHAQSSKGGEQEAGGLGCLN